MSLPCYHCKHFSYWTASPGYSENTPGSDATAHCGKSVWDYESVDGFHKIKDPAIPHWYPSNRQYLTIREALDTGLTCPHFLLEPSDAS